MKIKSLWRQLIMEPQDSWQIVHKEWFDEKGISESSYYEVKQLHKINVKNRFTGRSRREDGFRTLGQYYATSMYANYMFHPTTFDSEQEAREFIDRIIAGQTIYGLDETVVAEVKA